MDKKTIFTGGGCNAASLLTAIANGLNSPSKTTLPAAVTWPFATLSLRESSADFRMAHIKKSARATDAKVVLSKIGYLYFQSPDHANDFGFLTLKVGRIVEELRKRGYHLDKSCERNILIAKTFLVALLVISLAVVILVTTMAIIKPNGV